MATSRINVKNSPNNSGLVKASGQIKSVMDLVIKSSIYSQQAYAIGSSIALLSILIGRRYKTSDDIWGNVYSIAIGTTGSGKDSPRSIIKELALELGIKEKVIDSIASGPGLEDHLFNLESPELLIASDEFGEALKQRKQSGGKDHGVIGILLKMFTSVSSYYTKRSKAGNTAPPTVDHPFVSIYGTTTEELLLRSLTEEDAESGFLGRFLFFKTDSHRPQFHSKKHDVEIVNDLKSWLQKSIAATSEKGSVTVKYSQSAMKSLIKYQQLNDDKLRSDDIHPVTRSILVRLIEMTKKIAFISAVSRNPISPEISKRDVDWAKAVCKFSSDYIVNELTEALDGNVIQTRESINLQKCLDIIKRTKSYRDSKFIHELKQGFMPKRLLLKKMKTNCKNLDPIIETLIETGQIKLTRLSKELHGVTCKEAFHCL